MESTLNGEQAKHNNKIALRAAGGKKCIMATTSTSLALAVAGAAVWLSRTRRSLRDEAARLSIGKGEMLASTGNANVPKQLYSQLLLTRRAL